MASLEHIGVKKEQWGPGAQAALRTLSRETPDSSSWTETDDGFLWCGDEAGDVRSASAAFVAMLEKVPAVRSLCDTLWAENRVGWISLFNTRGDSPWTIDKQYDALARAVGPELMERLHAEVTGRAKGISVGSLGEMDLHTLGFGFMISPPGSPPQVLHIDYTPNDIVLLYNISKNPHDKTATHYFTHNEVVETKLRGMGSNEATENLNILDVLHDIPGASITSKRAPVATGRPVILHPNVMHRGMGCPEDAPFRIAFTATYIEKKFVDEDDGEIEPPLMNGPAWWEFDPDSGVERPSGVKKAWWT